jgi:DNA invertase Pin-like site-specific DNA recombinase
MKVALYARVSTDDQGQNPESQLFKLRKMSEARGYEVVGMYIDHKSGKDDNRPDFQRMLNDARAHKFDVILVTKLDRVMRSVKNLLKVLEDLERWKVSLECVDQPIETGSAMGKMMITILGAVAEFERELIRERVTDGIARAKSEGKQLGRPRVSDEKVSPDALRMRKKRAEQKGGVSALNINALKNEGERIRCFVQGTEGQK